MKQIDETKLDSLLKSTSVKPDLDWQQRAAALLDQKAEEPGNQSGIFKFLENLRMKFTSRVAIATVAAFVVLGTGATITVFAATNSKPGDPLFGLNKALENVQRNVTTNDQARLELEKNILKERENDLNGIPADNPNHALAEQELNDQQERLNEVANRSGDDNHDNVTGTPGVTGQEDDNNLQEDQNEHVGTTPSGTITPKPTKKPESESGEHNNGGTPSPTHSPEPTETEGNGSGH